MKLVHFKKIKEAIADLDRILEHIFSSPFFVSKRTVGFTSRISEKKSSLFFAITIRVPI